MASIDIGRVKFVWKGTYDFTITYKKDDVVYHSGSAWIYINATDAANNAPVDGSVYWNKMAQGSDLGSLSGLTTNDIIYYDGSSFQRLPIGTQGQALVVGASGLEWGRPKGVQQVQVAVDESTTGVSSYSAATEHELPWSVTLTASVNAPYFEVYSRCNVDDSVSTSFGADLGLKWAVVATPPATNVYTKIKAPQQHTQYHSGANDTYLQLHMNNYFQLSSVTAGQQIIFKPLVRSHNAAFRLFNNGNAHTPTRGGETIVKEYFF